MTAQHRQRQRRDPAVFWSLVGHGLLVAVILLGGLSLPRDPAPSQLAIKATVVEGAPPKRRSLPPPPAPVPEPEPEPAPAPEPEPEPDRAELERQAATAATEKAAREKAVQEKAAREKAAQEKVAREKAAREKAAQEKADQEKADQEKAAQEKAAWEQKAAQEKERQAKAAAERERAEQERAARELERQLAEEERLLAATDSGALAEYVGLIRQKVTRNWIRPPGAGAGLECEVLVTQIPGGEVAAVRVDRCNADDAVRRSIEAAVLRSSPLPLPADPALFERNLRFTFKPEQ